MVNSREAELDLMEKVIKLKILCKIRENLSGKVMIKERLNRKVVIITKEVLLLIEEEIILVLEEDFVAIVLGVEKDIDPLNVDILLKMKVVVGIL